MGRIGYVLQVVGLTVLPIAMLLELSNLLGRAFGLSQMVISLVFGVCAFMLGRMLEGHAKHGP